MLAGRDLERRNSRVNPVAERRPPLQRVRRPEFVTTQRAQYRLRQRPRWLSNLVFGAGVLSLVAGYVDAAGFLALFGLYPAHLTGEIVAGATALAEGGAPGALVRLTMLPLFAVAVAIATLVARIARLRGRTPLPILLAMMTLALAAFLVSGVVIQPLAREAPDATFLVVAGSSVVAMAFQNTLMREALAGSCPTTVMTGNLTQFVIELVEICVQGVRGIGAGEEPTHARLRAENRLRLVGTSLLGFSSGAVSGAWLTTLFGLRSIALPAAVVAALTARAWYENRN